MSDTLRKIIRELIEEELELDETTSSGAAGPYNTPFAFRGNAAAGKEKAKKNSTVATGYTMVDKTQEKADEAGPQDNDPVEFGEKGKGGLKAPKKEKVIQEAASDAIKKQQEKIRHLKSERDEKKRDSSGIDAAGKIAVTYRKRIEKAEKRLATLKSVASKKNESITESKYDDFKMAEGTIRKKIGEAIREISRRIQEVDNTLRMTERLKMEDGSGPDGQLWKSTAKALTQLEGRMNTMSTRIRNLKA